MLKYMDLNKNGKIEAWEIIMTVLAAHGTMCIIRLLF